MKRIRYGIAAFLAAAVFLPCFGGLRVNAFDLVDIEEEFPDPIFRAYVHEAFDKNGDWYLDYDEIYYIMNVHCENMGVTSVEGIENFFNLEGLWCKGNNISEWDLSGNPHLKGIWCSFNPFTELDFTGCDELEWVYCFNCDLEYLNVSNNPELAFLECNENPRLQTLDLTNNHKLENLFCSKCGLTSLDLSGNPMLCELACFYNDLRSIDLSNNPKMKRLDIWHNPELGNVDVTGLKELQYYNCAWTGLDKIDVRYNPELAELVAGYNGKLKTLDLSRNPKLAYLALECDVSLQELDVSKNPKLYYLLAFGLSSIDTIDISKNPRLCKAYNEGVYVHELEKLGYVYDMTLNYGGSSDPFDELRHCVAFDDRAEIIGKYNGNSTVTDCYYTTNDGHSNSETFATREQVVQLLYEKAGSPYVSGYSTFTDVSKSASYAKAITWAQDNNICFGYPNISSDTFGVGVPVNREDLALMAHRFADYMHLGTALDVDFYGWAAFTWAIQFEVIKPINNLLYPHGRVTVDELNYGVNKIFDLDQAASYSERVGGNYGGDYVAPYYGDSGNPGGHSDSGYSGRPNKPSSPSNSGSSTKPGSTGKSGSTGTTGSGSNDTVPAGNVGTFEDFVERLYVVALGRASEADGKAHWCKVVGNGSYTGADAARFFFTCPEFEGKNLSNEDYVKTLYATFFDRNATDDPDGYNFWLSKINDWGRRRVLEGFIDSAEWCNICADYGVRSGASTAKATRASKNATDFATRLYTECLGRDPETDGLNYWSLSLTNQERTGSQAAKEFFYSPEFKDKNLGDEEYINRLYKTFMGRNPDDDGKNYWLGQLGNGTMNRDQIFDFFSTCEEFTDICNQYAILR